MPQGRRKSAAGPPPGLSLDRSGPGEGSGSPNPPQKGGRKSNPRPARQPRPAAPTVPSADAGTPPPPPPGLPKTAKKGAPSTGKKSSAKPKKKKGEGNSNGGAAATPKQQPPRAAAATPSAGPSTSKRKGSRKAIYAEHLGPEEVAVGVAAGSLFLARLRCNAADRTQAFATLPGLPHDLFIPGWKPQNRAIEGDVVALRLLPLPQWRNMASKGWKNDRTSRKSVSGNVLPFSPPAASRADALTAAGDGEDEEEEGEPEVTSSAVVDSLACVDSTDIDVEEEEEAEDDLVLSPALLPSPSGGELPVAQEQVPLGLEGVEDGDEDEGDLSMVGYLTQQLASAALTPLPPATLPPAEDPDAPWTAAASLQEAVQIVSELLKCEFEGWRATAEVMAIATASDRRSSLVGVLRSYGPHTLALVPRDARLPRCLVSMRALRALGPERQAALLNEASTEDVPARTLVTGRIIDWDNDKRHPTAIIDDVVGTAGGLQAEVAALLTQERIEDDDAFTPAVLDCLPATPWAVSSADLAERKDLRESRIFSIDPPTARDLDDALSVEDLGGGLLRIGVHIADVSHFVRPGTALDSEASDRSTSVYLVDRVIPMLPRLLCEELCSLNPGVDRLAFSIIWTMTSDGVVQDTWAGRTVIRSCAKLSYPQVQGLIDGTTSVEGYPPEGVTLHDGHNWAEVAKDALMLHGVAAARRQKRFEVDGALRLDNVRLYFELDNAGEAVGCGIYEQKEANRLVEEFMLAANMSAAQMISEAFPDRALLRRHPGPNGAKMRELSATVARLLPSAPHLDVSSAGALQASLAELRAAVDPAVGEVVTLLCTKPMQVAQYFCTGDFLEDSSAWRHYALAVQHYTHFTSPIRRYPDVMVHRLLQAALDKAAGKKGAGKELARGDAVAAIAAHANDRKAAAKAAQDGALKLYLAAMLLSRPVVHTAVVVGLGGPRFFDAYVPSLGIDVRVHVDRMLAGGEAALDSQFSEQTMALSLACRATVAGTSRAAAVYDDVESFENLANPEGIEAVRLPLVLKALDKVPVVVGGARSKISGSPAGVHAKLYVVGQENFSA